MGKAPESIQCWGSQDGKLSVRILIDHCTVEVFLGGEVMFSTAYPTLEESDRLVFSPTRRGRHGHLSQGLFHETHLLRTPSPRSLRMLRVEGSVVSAALSRTTGSAMTEF